MHKTINARLRTLINHAQDDWDSKLSFMADLGRQPRSPLTALAETVASTDIAIDAAERFSVGDLVLVQAEALRTASVQASRPKSKWDRLALPPHISVHDVFNITKLKRYISRESFPDRCPKEPDPVQVDGQEERVGQEIISHTLGWKEAGSGHMGASIKFHGC